MSADFSPPPRPTLTAAALAHLPFTARTRALDLSAEAQISSELAQKFQHLEASNLETTTPAAGPFDFISANSLTILTLRQLTEILKENGILTAQIPNLSKGELTELARDLDFQILTLEPTGQIIWRKRQQNWRENLPDHAALASSQITKVVNAHDHSPVATNRGRYSSVLLTVDGLPIDADLGDLEIFAAGNHATATAIDAPDTQGLQQILAHLPSSDQTGLIPLEIHWFGERLTPTPAHIRVIPPGPLTPRIVSVATTRAHITLEIEELARPGELTASLDGAALWGLESRLIDSATHLHQVRVYLPEETPAGAHEIQLLAGRRKLAPIPVEI